MKDWLKLIRLNTLLFTLLFVVVSWRFYTDTPWPLTLLTAVVFSLITMSIMVFNDMIDSDHDFKKGKSFADKNTDKVVALWGISCLVTLVGFVFVWRADHYLAMFLVGIWFMGIIYSLFPLFYIGNNIIVVLCSASPALCGLIYNRDITTQPLLYFVVVFCVIYIREILKDIEDREADQDYKATLPVRTADDYSPGDHIYDYLRAFDFFGQYEQMRDQLPKQNHQFIRSFQVMAHLFNPVFFVTLFIKLPWSMAVAMLLMSAKLTGFFFLSSSDFKWVKRSKSILDLGLACLLALAFV